MSEEFMTGRVATRETAERDRDTELVRVIRAEHEARHDEDGKVGWVHWMQRHRAASAARTESHRDVAAVSSGVPDAVEEAAREGVAGPVVETGDGLRAAASPSSSPERRELEPAGR
ncbi:hypothetical protein [Leifsonia sp. NPDC058248]|uniref:hypothetical protein n=1 Tax=Leifsonia sp. NPDC058248 TaxID=3346402 RepID=UPI0036DF4F71